MQQKAKSTDMGVIVKNIWCTTLKLLQDSLAIFKLEAKLAAMSLMTVIVLFVLSIIWAVAVWLALWVGVAILLFQLGYSWPWVILQMVGFNIILLVISGWVIKRCLKNLFFSLTRKQFNSNPFRLIGDRHAAQSQETNSTA